MYRLQYVTGYCSNMKTVFPCMVILMIKIRRSWDRLIFIMGFPILARRYLTLGQSQIPFSVYGWTWFHVQRMVIAVPVMVIELYVYALYVCSWFQWRGERRIKMTNIRIRICTCLTLCCVLFWFGSGQFYPYSSWLLRWHRSYRCDCLKATEVTPKNVDVTSQEGTMNPQSVTTSTRILLNASYAVSKN